VVATDVGGTAEVVLDGTTGLLVLPHWPEGLAEALGALMGDPARGVDFGRAGRLHAEGVFAMQPWVDNLQDLYDEVIDLRPRRRRATLTSADPTSADPTRPDVETSAGGRTGGRRSEPGATAELARAVALAVLAALLVLGAGSAFVLTRSPTYEASVDVLVTPPAGASANDAASLLDSLSKGQVTATAAEIYRQRQWQGDRTGSIDAGVVTPSAVVQVVARASSETGAEELVQSVLAAADPTVNRVLDPYLVIRLDSAAPSATAVGLSRPVQLGLVALAALVGGSAVLRLTRPRPQVPIA
jgi:capsular polysaccharide biosynthesis protein